MKFLDEAKIFVKSGDGGAGCVAFRREKYVEFGGPNGGDGGRGGHVIVEAVPGLNTLIDFRYAQHHKGRRGNHGMGSDRSGGAGADCIVKVPAGTQILDETRQHVIADMKKEGDSIVLAKGGDGGLGNARFKTPTNRAPRIAGEGHAGEELWVWLRLKLFADAGLVGLPNAGKSTFLSAVSAASPKIADYPFTTLHPQLGVVQVGTQTFVLADLPGLIQGASDGAGIGTRFLGHIERCGAMIHLIDGTQEDIVGAYKTIRAELDAYGSGLEEKQEIVVLNKIDALTEAERKSKLKELQLVSGSKPLEISGVSGTGVSKLLHRTWDMVLEDRKEKDPNPPVWQPSL